MKKIFILFSLAIFGLALAAPISPINGGTGVSNSNANTLTVQSPITLSGSTSSALNINSTTQGSRPYPAMTQTQRDAIVSPEDGLTVYNTTTKTLDVFDNSTWQTGLNLDSLIAGSNITILNNGDGTVTISSSGGSPVSGGGSAVFSISSGGTTTFSNSSYKPLNVVVTNSQATGINVNSNGSVQVTESGTYNFQYVISGRSSGTINVFALALALNGVVNTNSLQANYVSTANSQTGDSLAVQYKFTLNAGDTVQTYIANLQTLSNNFIAQSMVGIVSQDLASSSTLQTAYTNGMNGAIQGNLDTKPFQVKNSGGTALLMSSETGIDIIGNASTVTNGVYTTGSYSNPSWITSLSANKISPPGVFSPTIGGTGSNNGSNTVVLQGPLVVNSATNDITKFTNTGFTDLTLPLTGTLLSDAGSYSNPTWLTLLSTAKLSGIIADANLADVITAGSAGSGNTVPSIAWDSKGRLTSVAPALITPAGIGAPTTTGTGASGTWGINISGNAATATSASDPNAVKLTGNQTVAGVKSFSNNTAHYSQTFESYFSDAGTILQGTVGLNGFNNDMAVQSTVSGKWLRLGANGNVAFWTDGNIGLNNNPTFFMSTGGIFQTSNTFNAQGLTASSLIATDGSKNFTSTTSGLSPTFAGMTFTGSPITGINSVLNFNAALMGGSYINLAAGGRNIGLTNGTTPFFSSGLNYDATAGNYVYSANNAASLLELALTGGSLKYAPTGTSGASVTPSTALSWSNAGVINIPNLTASSLVATDSSKNLTSTTSALTPTFDRLTVGGTTALSGTNSALAFANSLADGNYVQLGGGGISGTGVRNIGVYFNGATFIANNLYYDKTIPGFRYGTSNTAANILLGNTSGSNPGLGALQHAATGTLGNPATMVNDLTWNQGVIQIPGLSANSLVATDGSSNLVNTTSGITPTFAGLISPSVTAPAASTLALSTPTPASNVNASNLTITAANGSASSTSNGGSIVLTSGNGGGSSTGDAGSITGTAGNGSTAASGAAGNISWTAGNGRLVGGNASLIAGNTTVAGNGGNVTVTAGSSNFGGGIGGNVNITGGLAGGGTGAGGDVILTGGNSGTTSTSGNIRLKGGVGTGTAGSVFVDQGNFLVGSSAAYGSSRITESSGAAGVRNVAMSLTSPRSFGPAANDGTILGFGASNGAAVSHDYGAIFAGNNPATNDGGAGLMQLRVGGASESTGTIPPGVFMTAISTSNGSGAQSVTISTGSSNTTAVSIDGSQNVSIAGGNLSIDTVNKGLSIKSASGASGTANAAVVTGVVLVGGTKTITDSYVDTNTACYPSVVTAGGTPGTGYRVNIANGSFTITSSNGLDTSTLNVVCFKGN